MKKIWENVFKQSFHPNGEILYEQSGFASNVRWKHLVELKLFSYLYAHHWRNVEFFLISRQSSSHLSISRSLLKTVEYCDAWVENQLFCCLTISFRGFFDGNVIQSYDYNTNLNSIISRTLYISTSKTYTSEALYF